MANLLIRFVSFFDRPNRLYAKSEEMQSDYAIVVRCLSVANVQTTAGGGFVLNMPCIRLTGMFLDNNDPIALGISVPRLIFSDRIRGKIALTLDRSAILLYTSGFIIFK